MVALVHGGFPEISSKVTSFKSYFRQKTTKKDCSEGRKNVTFHLAKIVALVEGVFLKFCRKSNVSQNLSSGTGFFLKFCLKSQLLFFFSTK